MDANNQIMLHCNQYLWKQNFFVRFYNQLEFSLKKDIGEYEKGGITGFLEKVGDAGLWIIEEAPRKVWNVISDPRFVTIVLTAFAFLAVSAAFYPTVTWLATKAVIDVIAPYFSYEMFRFAAWSITATMVLSAGFGRAMGRWCNTALREHYYRDYRTATLQEQEQLRVERQRMRQVWNTPQPQAVSSSVSPSTSSRGLFDTSSDES